MLEFVAVILHEFGFLRFRERTKYIYIYILFYMTAENEYKALYIGRSIIFLNVNIRYVSKD